MAELMNKPAAAIVLAAGKGTRMKTELPKVLVQACGRPLIAYVLDALREASIRRIHVVVGYRADEVRKALAGQEDVDFVDQPEQLGTGHAVMVCRDALADHDGPVVIVTGDSPMLQSKSVRKLLAGFDRDNAACVMGTIHKPDPTGLGRVVRDEQGRFEAIVEERDATPEQRLITEVNMSTYVFDRGELFAALDQLRPDNAQGEYYVTDCPGILKRAGKRVEALPVLEQVEALSVNTVDDLQEVEEAMRRLRS